MTEWHDACEVINEAVEKCDQFSDYVDKDKAARFVLKILTAQIDIARECAQKLLDKAEKWADLERARRYPHPTKREISEHNEE